MQRIALTSPDGLSLSLLHRAGTGTPVLVLPGWGVTAACWAAVFARIPGHDCFILDARGQGQSAPIPREVATLAASDHVGDAASAWDRHFPGPCHIVGHSLGGMVGIELALARPALVRSLSLVGYSADGELPENAAPYRALADAITTQGITDPILELACAVWLSPAGSADIRPDGLRARVATLLRSADRHSIAAGLRGIVDRPVRMADLHRLAMPVLSLIGSEDRSISPARQRATAARFPHSTVIDLPGVGHLPFLENEDATVAVLLAHLHRADRALTSAHSG